MEAERKKTLKQKGVGGKGVGRGSSNVGHCATTHLGNGQHDEERDCRQVHGHLSLMRVMKHISQIPNVTSNDEGTTENQEDTIDSSCLYTFRSFQNMNNGRITMDV